MAWKEGAGALGNYHPAFGIGLIVLSRGWDGFFVLNNKTMHIAVEKAAVLLWETGLPIAETAREVGYQKAGAFADGYRACTGYLPSETRRRGLP